MSDPSSSGLLDFCPRCRIQAPHRPGRDTCPRCSGPLSVISPGSASSAPAVMRTRQSAPATPSTAQRRPASPRSGRSKPRVFRNPNMRWTAQRPPEARPPARTVRKPGRGPIPRYDYIPQWGLRDLDPDWSATPRSARDTAARQLTQSFVVATIVFAITAVVHLARYVLVSVNRTVVVPGWTDRLTVWLVLFTGVCAVLSVVMTALALARWIIEVRADIYHGIGRVEPRPWWQLWPAVVIPVVNLIGPGWLLYEVAGLDADAATFERRRRRMIRMEIAWLIVNAFAALALTYQFAANSVQNRADGLFFVIVSSAVSALFAWWIRVRLTRVFDAPAPVVVEAKTRWVIAQ